MASVRSYFENGFIQYLLKEKESPATNTFPINLIMLPISVTVFLVQSLDLECWALFIVKQNENLNFYIKLRH